jgi:hypothetical protein
VLDLSDPSDGIEHLRAANAVQRDEFKGGFEAVRFTPCPVVRPVPATDELKQPPSGRRLWLAGQITLHGGYLRRPTGRSAAGRRAEWSEARRTVGSNGLLGGPASGGSVVVLSGVTLAAAMHWDPGARE